MTNFRTSSENILQAPAREEVVEALLDEAGATKLPTDEDKILDFLDLKQLSLDFMSEVDFLPKHGNKTPEIRAALSLNDRLVVTQSGLNEKRKRFGIFHEIGHFISEEHRQKLFKVDAENVHVDTDATLSWWTKLRMEREANEIAAELLFQGYRFTKESLSYPTSIRTVLRLAPEYGASYESALRRYTERHVLPVALVVFDRVQRAPSEHADEDAEFKLQYTITSPSFRKKYFSGLESSELLKQSDFFDNGLFRRDVVGQELKVESSGERFWNFETEVFTNTYKLFQFVLKPS